MGLLAELGVKPSDVNISDIEKQMEGNGLPPEGIHHAVLTTAGGIPNADGRGWRLTFEIIAGPGKGMTVEEALWKPKGDDAKKDQKTRNRVLLFGHRLGLMKKVKDPATGKESSVEIEGKHDFCDCLGATTFVELQHEEEKYDKGGVERKITKAKLTFHGLYDADEKKVKDAIAAGKLAVAGGAAVAASKAAALAGGGAAGGGAVTKDQLADL